MNDDSVAILERRLKFLRVTLGIYIVAFLCRLFCFYPAVAQWVGVIVFVIQWATILYWSHQDLKD